MAIPDQDARNNSGKGEAPAALAAGPPVAAASMGDSVTPHALITGPMEWRYLIAGIDTLDLGLYVDWGMAWYVIQPQLEHHREATLSGEKKIWRHDIVGESIVRGSSKRNYRYHIQRHDLNMWFANTEEPNNFPNVYVSPSAQSLWIDGPIAVVEGIRHLIAELGGQVMEVQVSRCDLAADFAVPEGIGLEFLRRHLVSRTRSTNHYEKNGRLETFYVARRGAPLQARIYNKLAAILAKPEGQYFFALWGGVANAWRVEFQLKRDFLRSVKIVGLDDLLAKVGGLWSYLTDQWLSLREPDNANTRRRTMHPWWSAVQGVADQFGPTCTIGRGKQTVPLQDPSWFIAHMSGCLVSLAACRGMTSIEDALADFNEQAKSYWQAKCWEDAYACKRIQGQRPTREEGGEDVPF